MANKISANIEFRGAIITDLKILNPLIRISKAYWGYSEDFMNKFMEKFQLTENYLANNTVKILLVNNDIAGLCGFKLHQDEILELDYFFIHPHYIGQGLGKVLWDFSCKVAKQLTDNSFILWSDPQAEAFYLKM